MKPIGPKLDSLATSTIRRPPLLKPQPQTATQTTSSTGRMTRAGLAKMQAELKKLNASIKSLTAKRDAHVAFMASARFTPEGAKAAQATLNKMNAQLAKLEKERDALIEFMTRA